MFESFFIYTIHPTIQSATHNYVPIYTCKAMQIAKLLNGPRMDFGLIPVTLNMIMERIFTSHKDRPVGSSNRCIWVVENQFAVSPVLKHWRYSKLTPSQQNLVIKIGQCLQATITVLCYRCNWFSGNQFAVSSVLKHRRCNKLTPSQQHLQSSR